MLVKILLALIFLYLLVLIIGLNDTEYFNLKFNKIEKDIEQYKINNITKLR